MRFSAWNESPSETGKSFNLLFTFESVRIFACYSTNNAQNVSPWWRFAHSKCFVTIFLYNVFAKILFIVHQHTLYHIPWHPESYHLVVFSHFVNQPCQLHVFTVLGGFLFILKQNETKYMLDIFEHLHMIMFIKLAGLLADYCRGWKRAPW